MAKAKRCVRSSKATLRPANRPPPPTSRGTAAASNPCHIGIDIGSHRTRIAIWADGTEIVVENKHSFSLEHYPGDFPSALYVFDKDGSPSADDIYLVDREDPNRLSVSAKYVFYALADASDTLLEQYPLLHHLMTKKKDPSFKDRLRRGMIQLLTVLRDRAMAVCKARNWHVRKIGLTIPVQWTLEFEEVYCGLVSEVFQIDPGVVYFFTETEALARYLFKHHGAQIDPNEQHNAVMFYDYGGHNMNGCVFGVARDVESPERHSFFRVGKTFGCGGGSQQWEYYIARWFNEAWAGVVNFNAAPPPKHREELLAMFRKQKGLKAESRQEITLSGSDPTDRSLWRINLTLEDIQAAWQKGLKRPLETAKREIGRLTRMIESGHITKPLVVVSGGTARNPAVKSRMQELCDEAGVPVLFTDDFDISIAYDSAKVAKAAAYVVSETLTVEEFFARGAAIGIQMKQYSAQKGPRAAPRVWDDSGALLLGRRWRKKLNIAVRHDQFQLICDPYFERLPSPKKTCVSAKLSYDLVYLGKRKQGSWLFQPSLDGSGDKMTLVLRQFYRRRKDMLWERENTLHLPLYYDGNSGCIHVGERDKTLDELDLGLPLQPSETGETGTGTSTSEESDSSDAESVCDPDAMAQQEIAARGLHDGEGSGHRVADMFGLEREPGRWREDLNSPPPDVPVRHRGASPVYHGLPLPSPPTVTSDLGWPNREGRRAEPYRNAWQWKKTASGL